jgi:hypothetical protein
MATKRKPPKPRNFPLPEAAITAYVEGLALIAAGEIDTPEYDKRWWLVHDLCELDIWEISPLQATPRGDTSVRLRPVAIRKEIEAIP